MSCDTVSSLREYQQIDRYTQPIRVLEASDTIVKHRSRLTRQATLTAYHAELRAAQLSTVIRALSIIYLPDVSHSFHRPLPLREYICNSHCHRGVSSCRLLRTENTQVGHCSLSAKTLLLPEHCCGPFRHSYVCSAFFQSAHRRDHSVRRV